MAGIGGRRQGEAMQAAPGISIVALFLNADIVVQGVLLVLLAASVWSWAVIVDKLWRLRVVGRAVAAHEARAAAARSPDELWRGGLELGMGEASDPAAQVLIAGLQESEVAVPLGAESIGERRERVERAMRLALNAEMRRLETHLPYLATLGSAAPFIGLFGTVWGIMRSFAGIAAANSTSLAVVAPGIAEALFATAMGLAAAIPAVVAYNKITVELGRLAGRMQGLIGRSGGLLSRAAEV
jgi:biopolymer transport protein TolQ